MNNFSEGNKIIFIATDLLFSSGILCSSNGKLKDTGLVSIQSEVQIFSSTPPI